MSETTATWTDDLRIPIAPGRQTDELIDLVFEAMLTFAPTDPVCLMLQQRFGLSADDVMLALDRIPGGVVRALTGNAANCPDPTKDPLAYASFQRVWAEFPLTAISSQTRTPSGRWVKWFEDLRKKQNADQPPEPHQRPAFALPAGNEQAYSRSAKLARAVIQHLAKKWITCAGAMLAVAGLAVAWLAWQHARPVTDRALLAKFTQGIPSLAEQRKAWPSDESMAALFKAHRPTFERLVAMVREDRKNGVIPPSPVRMDPSWGRPDQPNSQTKMMSMSRFAEYEKLFRSLGLRYGITVGETHEIDFDVACVGVLSIGPCSYKGIVYRPEIPASAIVDSLEDGALPHKESAVAPGYYFKALAPDWFVYRYEFD